MAYRLNLHIESVENGQFVAVSSDIPGLVAQGRSIRETIEIAEDVAKKIIESYEEHHDALPKSLQVLNEKIPLDIAVAI